MKHLSLFSGIGGIDIAAEWAGFETICFVENDKYCQKVLKKHWPNVPIIEDVKNVTKERIQEVMADTISNREVRDKPRDRQRRGLEQEGVYDREQGNKEIMADTENGKWEEKITLVSGGFPCQPHSVAGKREGSTDERNLWPEFRRVIGEIKPRWVLAENVPGLFTSDARRFFGTILADLAEMGYSAGWATYGAVDVGALHRRNRVFIVAYSNNGRQPSGLREAVSWRKESTDTDTESSSRSQRRDSILGTGEAGVVGDSEHNGYQNGHKETRGKVGQGEQGGLCQSEGTGDVADTCEQGLQGYRDSVCENQEGWEEQSGHIGQGSSGWRSTQCRLGKPTNGIPGRLDCNWGDGWEDGTPRVTRGQKDRVARLKALGNAVVPQQIFPILQAIAGAEKEFSENGRQ